MAVPLRKTRINYVVASYALLAGTLCQPCWGFVGFQRLSTQTLRQHERVDMFVLVNPTKSSNHGVGARSRRVSSAIKTRIRMLASPVELWSSYLDALQAAPLLTKSITAGVIFPAADAVAQSFDKKKRQEKDIDVDSWDFARTLRWLFFGFAVQAPWNHFFYVLLDGALPPTPDPFSATTGIKVFIDQFIQAPVFTVLIFGVLGLLEGKQVVEIREKLNQDYKSTMLANWGVFVPAAVVNLAFCPPELRVLFLNVVFFGWTIFLSTVVS
ncbi:unnamed protein product, partial [Ascophyllum nodosum]